jgi:hypothetical protein
MSFMMGSNVTTIQYVVFIKIITEAQAQRCPPPGRHHHRRAAMRYSRVDIIRQHSRQNYRAKLKAFFARHLGGAFEAVG